ncbi:hypothetical protein [Microbaculum sp. FT89]|uniref:hypothetical protein n=1 Tax=Microbaculum sp. FT89 TaxID=3447298 RepID=UPI003F5366C6
MAARVAKVWDTVFLGGTLPALAEPDALGLTTTPANNPIPIQAIHVPRNDAANATDRGDVVALSGERKALREGTGRPIAADGKASVPDSDMIQEAFT